MSLLGSLDEGESSLPFWACATSLPAVKNMFMSNTSRFCGFERSQIYISLLCSNSDSQIFKYSISTSISKFNSFQFNFNSEWQIRAKLVAGKWCVFGGSCFPGHEFHSLPPIHFLHLGASILLVDHTPHPISHHTATCAHSKHPFSSFLSFLSFFISLQ